MDTYEIERADGRIIVRMGSRPKLNAPETSYIVYKDAAGEQRVSKVKDLTDEQLLLALANWIELPTT